MAFRCLEVPLQSHGPCREMACSPTTRVSSTPVDDQLPGWSVTTNYTACGAKLAVTASSSPPSFSEPTAPRPSQRETPKSLASPILSGLKKICLPHGVFRHELSRPKRVSWLPAFGTMCVFILSSLHSPATRYLVLLRHLHGAILRPGSR